MNCHDFERAWNERLDARTAPQAVQDLALIQHASSCPACRALGSRYSRLALAIDAPRPSTIPSPGFVDRVLAANVSSPRSLARPVRVWLVPLAAAAAVLAFVALGPRGWSVRPPAPDLTPPAATVARVEPIDTDDLTEALVMATSATWGLAREASAPAARVGRQILGSASLPGPRGSLALSGGMTPAAEVLQSLGGRVNAGVQPLGGTARHAFSFLLGSSTDDPAFPTKHGG
ncbi:MAG: hypothetical protein NVSMB9_16440 [Isosphaeraceae bacterium]